MTRMTRGLDRGFRQKFENFLSFQFIAKSASKTVDPGVVVNLDIRILRVMLYRLCEVIIVEVEVEN